MKNSINKPNILNHIKSYLSDIQYGYFIENTEEMYIYIEALNSNIILSDTEKLIDVLNKEINNDKITLQNAYNLINHKIKSFEVHFDEEYDLNLCVPYPNKLQTLEERNFNLFDIITC